MFCILYECGGDSPGKYKKSSEIIIRITKKQEHKAKAESKRNKMFYAAFAALVPLLVQWKRYLPVVCINDKYFNNWL